MRTTRWALLPLALLAGAARAEDRKPNILVILCDDVGYGEFGFQGAADIPTPNIDSIAANGVKFTQGYVSGPYCSPTRAGLLTGRYQTRFGHEFNSAAAPPNGLSLDERTIANRLKTAGYATAAVGKWHLGAGPKYLPMARGFDEFYGTVANTPYLNPPNFVDSRVSGQVTPVKDDSFYTTDAYAARATDWLDRHKDEPWFLYLPFNAQHGPLQATEKYLARFPEIKDPRRKTFSAMMSAMDDAVGAVLSKVRDLGQEENTLIFFLSDNGGPTQATTSRNGPLRGFKATTWEGGVRVPFCVQWKGTIPAGQTYDKPVIQLDILPTCLAAAGSPVDPAWKLDGVDLLPFLTGESTGTPHETLYWRFGPQRAIRHGDYKLVVGNGGSGQPELYDLSADLGETKNLASEKSEKVRELEALYKTWDAEQADPVTPKENPNAKKKKGAAKKKMQAKKKAGAAN